MLSDDWRLVLKLEHLQVTGSFKARGAFNLLLQLDADSGVVAASGGNYGKAIAFAADQLDRPAVVFVPKTSPEEKTGQIARFGADVKVIDGYYDDALEASREHAESSGWPEAHAYDDPRVMAGQGTVGLEISQQVGDASSVLVAVGGGGLIGGVASWYRGSTRVIGVESELCPTLHTARSEGAPVDVEVGGVAASSLGARRVGLHPWTANQWIEASVLVSDDAILDAQSWLWDSCRLWVEPAAATTVAALREGIVEPGRGETVVCLISGANVALAPTG